MMLNKLGALVLIGCFAVTAGCVSLPKTYSSEERPISPELGGTVMDFYRVIDTRQPVLRWKDIKSEGQSYDVAVWESRSQAPDKSITGTPLKPRQWGKQINYAQGLSRNYFKIGKPLKPETCYHWSVRIRTGKDVSEWATFSQTAVSPIGVGSAYQVPYGFITPRE
ncbi:MAG: hypothetical protein P4L55_08465 [Syntrophobacteraceae bacterium]|nr:hypothetical protein [Syntrophobacteraceae bacterium]